MKKSESKARAKLNSLKISERGGGIISFSMCQSKFWVLLCNFDI
jgi:hypothetical protein